MSNGLRVCYFGAYDPVYPRNAILRRGLRRCGVEVLDCRVPPSTPIVLRPAVLLARFARLPTKRFDAFIVAELNQEVVALARLLGAARRTPLLFDIFFSKYDSAVCDRATTNARSPRALALRLADRAAMRLADVVLADTAAHAAFYRSAFSLPGARFEVIPVGADDQLFAPLQAEKPAPGECLVGFWGTYIPLHGVGIVVEAAALLREEPVRFELIGRGQTFPAAARLVERLGLSNVRLPAPMPLEELATHARSYDIALGIFGDTPKAARVVPHKVYQAMLSGLPVITRDSAAVREFFRDGEHLMLVPPTDPPALAAMIRRLRRQPGLRASLGRAAYHYTSDRFTPGPLGRRLASIIAGLVQGKV